MSIRPGRAQIRQQKRCCKKKSCQPQQPTALISTAPADDSNNVPVSIGVSFLWDQPDVEFVSAIWGAGAAAPPPSDECVYAGPGPFDIAFNAVVNPGPQTSVLLTQTTPPLDDERVYFVSMTVRNKCGIESTASICFDTTQS